jgi:Flp pilus assembly protein TadD
MGESRAVVLPFGVPPVSRGLGLGVAALLHDFFSVQNTRMALVQVIARPREHDAQAHAVEALVPPQAWRDMPGVEDTPAHVHLVVTGTLQPPAEGRGALQILAFDARSLELRAKIEAPLDEQDAGRVLVRSLRELAERIDGDMGALAELEGVSWDALESVLRAERCTMIDPERGDAHDRLAAVMHLARAIADAPQARFAAGRLAALALDTSHRPGIDSRIAESALRALVGAIADAPQHVELLEATSVMHLRAGDPANAEVVALRALGLDGDRGRLYAMLSEARRQQGNLDGAEEAVRTGMARAPSDFVLLTEHGSIAALRGDDASARAAWERALELAPGFPPAFVNLTMLAGRSSDGLLAQRLVDHALSLAHPPLETLRHAAQLAMAAEPPGTARAARVAALCRAFLAQAPQAEMAMKILAGALEELGATEELGPLREKLAKLHAAEPAAARKTSWIDRLLGRK